MISVSWQVTLSQSETPTAPYVWWYLVGENLCRNNISYFLFLKKKAENKSLHGLKLSLSVEVGEKKSPILHIFSHYFDFYTV